MSRCALATLLAGPVLLAGCGSRPLIVTVLAINDLHGALEGSSASAGVAALAAEVAARRARNPNSAVVSAGDLVGASPLLSALYHDEPTIEALNLLGLQLSAVGNHEFDEGRDELLRLQRGGCHRADPGHSCQGAVPFPGAAFTFLAANVRDSRGGATLFPAYALRAFEGTPVAFIGLSLRETPSLVRPSAVAGLQFQGEAETANALLPEIRARGAEAVVLLLHQGGTTTGGSGECTGLEGALAGIVAKLDDEVDLVLSGHTHRAYVCWLPNREGRRIPVTSAGSFGRFLTSIELTLDRGSRDVTATVVANHPVDQGLEPVPALVHLVERYRKLAAPLIDRPIGTIRADLVSDRDTSGDSSLGQVIADAQLEAARLAPGGATVAFMNADGIRADLLHAASGPEGDGTVTLGEAFAVQPFGNALVAVTLTGQQVLDLLEQQWAVGQPYPRVLQVSQGFTYQHTFDPADFAASRGRRHVCPGSVRIGGVPLDGRGRYRVAVNSYLAEGGAGFTVFAEGADRAVVGDDLAALEAYLAAHSPLAPPGPGRIRKVDRCR